MAFNSTLRPEPAQYRAATTPTAWKDYLKLEGLSDELRLMDLRRTGTTQMVEAGVSMGQIMSVTGHSNPQSVKPYMKNTYASANNALTARKSHGKST